MLKRGEYHNCRYCQQQFHQKFNFDRHVLCCEFLHKSTKEREHEIDITQQLPSMKDMYQLMQHMMVRITKLENENSKLKRYSKGKVSALDWLNDKCKSAPPSITLSDWIRNSILPNVKNYLDVVFKQDLLSGLIALFDNSISKADVSELPICAFDTNMSIIYVYKKKNGEEGTSDDPIWMKITNADLDKYLRRISNQFSYDFKTHWYDVHQKEVETNEEYSEMYVNYYKQILGGKMTDDTRFHKLRVHIANQVRRNLKSVVEYDIV